jgi:virulence factor
MGKVKIGFIGTGGFARKAHYPSLAKIEGAEIAAICGKSNIEKRDEIAEEYNIKERYTDYKEMLAKADIDAVYAIRKPIYNLTQISCDVLAAGKHLFIEKPPALSVKEMKILVKAAKKSGCNTMVAFNRRFVPILVEAKNRVAEKEISSISGNFYKYQIKQEIAGYSQLLSNGIHTVDTLRWLADSEVKDISIAAGNPSTKHDNTWMAVMRFKNGIIGTLLTSYSVGARTHAFEIHGNGISAFVDPNVSASIYSAGDANNPTVLDTKEFAGSEDRIEWFGLRQENQHFIDSIIKGQKSMPDFEDSLKTMELVERIEKGGI